MSGPLDHPTKEDLLEQIKAAFLHVNRIGGVSWSEADAIDDYGSDAVRAQARASDTDKTWMEVALDPNWTIDSWESNWTFLDDVGFRYYIPAAMVRYLLLGRDSLESHRLTPPDCFGQWNFTPLQRTAIANFMLYRIREEQKAALLAVLNEADMTYEQYLELGETWTPEVDPEWSTPFESWRQFLLDDD